MMVTEYSKRTLGFLVHGVDRIIRVDWDKVRAPESVTGGSHAYITAITELPNGKLVSIVDVEQIMANTFGEGVDRPDRADAAMLPISIFSSSMTPSWRGKKLPKFWTSSASSTSMRRTDMEAWTRLSGMAAHAQQTGQSVRDEVNLILVDAEMPEMDGYVLTKNIKSDARFDGIPVVMHSSLSSEANRAMGKSVGVDAYVAKFDAEVLAETLRPLLIKSARD